MWYVVDCDVNSKRMIAVGNNTMDYKAGDSFFVPAGEKVVSVEGTGVIIVTKVWDIVYLKKLIS